MAATKVNLTSSARANLLALQGTASFIGRTQERLATGKRVNSALDDAQAFFQARSLTNRSRDLANAKDKIDQGISTLKAAVQAVESIEALVEQIRGIASGAKSEAVDTQGLANRSNFASQARSLATQINNLVNDASYQGINLIASVPSNLEVNFNETTAAELTVTGKTLTAGALSINTTTGDFATNGAIDADLTRLDMALSTLRTEAARFGSNNTLLTTRLDFTNEFINTLDEGAGKLTLADLNEESANLLALQTRQQLAINSLGLAAQSEQSVLSLFG
jgi:flagellin-like hook-associated protein FlgL